MSDLKHAPALEDPSGVYVALPAAGDLGSKWSALAGRPVAFAVWTTTPWTLAASRALSADPGLEYVFYALGKQVLLVARGRLSRFLSEVAPDELKVKRVAVGEAPFDGAVLLHPERILAYASGEELACLPYLNVLSGERCTIVIGEQVTPEQGTGLVDTAPLGPEGPVGGEVVTRLLEAGALLNPAATKR